MDDKTAKYIGLLSRRRKAIPSLTKIPSSKNVRITKVILILEELLNLAFWTILSEENGEAVDINFCQAWQQKRFIAVSFLSTSTNSFVSYVIHCAICPSLSILFETVVGNSMFPVVFHSTKSSFEPLHRAISARQILFPATVCRWQKSITNSIFSLNTIPLFKNTFYC